MLNHSLETLLNFIHQAIEIGIRDRTHPTHIATIATIALDNTPRLRSVVIRTINISQNTVTFHADARSPKVQQMQKQPKVELHWYHPYEKYQIRGRGYAMIHINNDIAQKHWESTQLISRRCYLTIHAPGTPIIEPLANLPPSLIYKTPIQAMSESGEATFSVAEITIEEWDCLFLNKAGHERAKLIKTKDGWTAHWCSP